MICKVCGRNITNEEANFCEYCGASFRPGMNNKVSEEEYKKQSMDMNPYKNSTSGFQGNSGYGYANQNGDPKTNEQNPNMTRPGFMDGGLFGNSDKPMTFGNWMLIYLLPFIPMVGIILFLVLLFSWGFGTNVPATKKNWARATMIYGIIMIIYISVLLSSGILGEYAALFGTFGNGI